MELPASRSDALLRRVIEQRRLINYKDKPGSLSRMIMAFAKVRSSCSATRWAA